MKKVTFLNLNCQSSLPSKMAASLEDTTACDQILAVVGRRRWLSRSTTCQTTVTTDVRIPRPTLKPSTVDGALLQVFLKMQLSMHFLPG